MLVLLPGIQAGPPEFDRLVPLLGVEALVLPLPASTDDTLLSIAAALLPSLPPGPHDFLGASFGGLLAWALPSERVRSLTTIGTLPWRTAAAVRSGRVGRLLPLLPSPLSRRLYQDRVRVSLEDDGADADILAQVRTPPRDVLAARLRAIGAWQLPAAPAARATWMWGATDPWVTWDQTGVQAAGHDGVIVPGGHRPHLSHPSEVARWLRGRGVG